MKNVRTIFVATLLIFVLSNLSFATNGMNMIGYGARMSGMGGVSLAMKYDTNLINTNPAGITSIKGQRIDLGIGLLMPSVHFKNVLNSELNSVLNDVDADKEIFPLPALGYVNGLGESPFAFGFGLYAQGGMGGTYPEIKHNIFRNYQSNPEEFIPQEYHSNIAYLKFEPTVAYQVNPQLSTGLALNVGYAMMEMKMPYSIAPNKMTGEIPGMGGMTFGDMFGAPMDQGGLGYDEITAYADMGDAVTATGFGAKIGLQYQVMDELTIGITYGMKSTLNFSGKAGMDMTAQFGDAFGKMVNGKQYQYPDSTAEWCQGAVMQDLANMGIDMSKGMIADYDADIEFSWPQEFGFGVAFQASDKLTVASDIRWINWKDTMEKFVMKFSNGTNENVNLMMGGEDMTLEMPMNWDDQLAVAVGVEYSATPQLTLRTGFNYASNPVPAETAIAIFPAIVETHITGGFGYKITDAFGVDIAYEYVAPVELETETSIIAHEYNHATNKLSENVFHISTNFGF